MEVLWFLLAVAVALVLFFIWLGWTLGSLIVKLVKWSVNKQVVQNDQERQ